MKDLNQKLLIEQTDKKLNIYKPLLKADIPEKGWIHTIRTALGMSYRQLSERLKMSPSASQKIEEREQEGRITLKVLEETAQALDMKLVYGFIPKDGSIQSMIEKRAYELAKEIVLRTSQNMALEDQKAPDERLKKAIEDRAQQIAYEMPRYLWD